MAAAALIVLAILVVTAAALAAASVRILREYERAVVFRLGRVIDEKGPVSSCSSPPWTAWSACPSAP